PDFPPTNAHLIPALAEQWQSLDLREILSRPAAFLSVSQSNSLYRPGGAQYGEGHAFRGRLPATLTAVRAARAEGNCVSFNRSGVAGFGDDYPLSDLDRGQYRSWIESVDT